MKNPLNYQRTEYDCGPTTLGNAISYLFPRDEIPPDILKYIALYSMDAYNEKGEYGKNGTSCMAMMFMSSWLNQFGKAKRFPIESEYLCGEQVYLQSGCKIFDALQQGGVVVARVMYDCWHYVLLTGSKGKHVYLWDPYYRVRPFQISGAEIEMITDFPTKRNRRVKSALLNAEEKSPYAFGPVATREAVLLFNKNNRRKPETLQDYNI